MREIILSIIKYSQGIKESQLCLKVMERTGPGIFNRIQFLNDVQALVDDKEIEYLNYKLPNHMIKMIYFPKGTEFYISKDKK